MAWEGRYWAFFRSPKPVELAGMERSQRLPRMIDQPAIRPNGAVGHALAAAAREILGEALAALDDPAKSDAVAVHDYRKAMKRWRALLRLLGPFIGPEAEALRAEARDLARDLAGARDAQSALDALDDLDEPEQALAATALTTMRGRIEEIRQSAEATTLTEAMRGRLRAAATALNGRGLLCPFRCGPLCPGILNY